MYGIMAIWISCILFIHLGLGETICTILRKNITILKCVKCLTFQSILLYSLIFTRLRVEYCVCLAFSLAYASLWIDLVLAKIADAYEKCYDKILVAKETEHNKCNRRGESRKFGKKKKKTIVQ